jgi:hypothetical protein
MQKNENIYHDQPVAKINELVIVITGLGHE